MSTVKYVVKYNTQTKEIHSIADAGGSYGVEGPVSGEENISILFKYEMIQGNYAHWCATHFVKDGAFIERDYRPSNYHFWNPETETWVPDYTGLWDGVREHRNKLLTECDWTQALDAPLTEEKKAEWRTYRQALRDVPLQEENQPEMPPYPEFITMEDVTWPTPPE
jgi:hypothetical protein